MNYAFYIWTAYGVSAAGIAAAVVLSVLERRRARKILEKLQ